MKSALATMLLALIAAGGAQSAPPPVGTGLDSVLAKVQQTATTTDADLVQLHIDRWRIDGDNKAQLQQISTSLHKNLTLAVPDLIREVQSGKGSVSASFKLYHNLNVVYEYLNSLADAAGSLGKREEYEPLNRDAIALDSVRRELSAYIEQAAVALEAKARPTPTPVPPPAAATPKKIIIDDEPAKKPVSSRKKKTSKPVPQPTPTPQ